MKIFVKKVKGKEEVRINSSVYVFFHMTVRAFSTSIIFLFQSSVSIALEILNSKSIDAAYRRQVHTFPNPFHDFHLIPSS
jgi:hypothetical protein